MPDDNMKATENTQNTEKMAGGEEVSLNDGTAGEPLPSDSKSAARETLEEGGVTAAEEKTEEKSELDELKVQLATARADLYNYRQRVERERIKNRKMIAEDKMAEFLPVLDNLDRALLVPEDGTAKDVLVGVRMVQRQFLSVLESSDVKVIPTEACPFDPLLHDAVETELVDAQEQDGMILGELLRGYKTPDRVLRPAQVRVGRLKTDTQN